MKDAYERGARALGITSAGEPTVVPDEVTKVLKLARKERLRFTTIKLYTNGIRIGEDWGFQDVLAEWRDLGLTDVYLTVHSFGRKENARLFGIKSYPSIPTVFGRICAEGLRLRVNLVLIKGRVDTAPKLRAFVKMATDLGADRVAAWPKRGADDRVATEIPEADLEEMVKLSETLPVAVYWPPREARGKLCLFPDGVVRDTWCR